MAAAPGSGLPVPEGIDFNHPYTPYDVQTDFMKTAYGVLQAGNGQVGILESPTGTVCHGSSFTLVVTDTQSRVNLFRSSVHL